MAARELGVAPCRLHHGHPARRTMDGADGHGGDLTVGDSLLEIEPRMINEARDINLNTVRLQQAVMCGRLGRHQRQP